MKDLHKTVVSKYRKEKIEFPKDIKAEDHTERMQDYLNKVLEIEALRDNIEIRQKFQLDFFYTTIAEEENEYEGVMC